AAARRGGRRLGDAALLARGGAHRRLRRGPRLAARDERGQLPRGPPPAGAHPRGPGGRLPRAGDARRTRGGAHRPVRDDVAHPGRLGGPGAVAALAAPRRPSRHRAQRLGVRLPALRRRRRRDALRPAWPGPPPHRRHPLARRSARHRGRARHRARVRRRHVGRRRARARRRPAAARPPRRRPDRTAGRGGLVSAGVATAGRGAAALSRARHGLRTLGPGGVVSAAVVLLVLLAALWPGLLAPGGPTAVAPAQAYRPPGADALLGTDASGRDVYTRVVHGAGQSLGVGAAATAIGLALGLVLGFGAALGPRWLDGLLNRVIEVLFALPSLVLALLLVAVLGAGVGPSVLA